MIFEIIQVLEVECPPGNLAGSVEQNIDVYRPTFDINDENGEVQYVIEGPSFCQSCWRDCCNFCCAKCCFLGINNYFLHISVCKKTGV